MAKDIEKIIKEFEEEFGRCLNEYWYNLTPLEKQRYLMSSTPTNSIK